MLTFENWTDQTDPEKPTQADLPMLPDGRHAAQINYVAVKTETWAQNQLNPQGTIILLGIDVPNHKRVWESVPIDRRSKLEALCRSAGVARPTPPDPWDEDQLKGKWVSIETVVRMSKAGREFVAVERFHGDKQPLPDFPERPKATKPKAERPEDLTPDDIPF
jgi:hypothetical protein